MASMFDRGPTALELLTAKKEQVFADLQDQLRKAAASRSNTPVLAGGMASIGSALGKALGGRLSGESAEETEARAEDEETSQARLKLGKAIQGGTPALRALIGEFAGENSPHMNEAIQYYNQFAAMDKASKGGLGKPVTTNTKDMDNATNAMDDYGIDAETGDADRVAKLIKEYETINEVPFETAREAVMNSLPIKMEGSMLPFLSDNKRIDWGSTPASTSPASQGIPSIPAHLNFKIEERK